MQSAHDFAFTLPLDPPRRLTVNAAARMRFREIAGFELDALAKRYGALSTVEKLGAAAVLLYACDPTLTLEDAKALMLGLLIEGKSEMVSGMSVHTGSN